MSYAVRLHVDWSVAGTSVVTVPDYELEAVGISLGEVLENPRAAFERIDSHVLGDLRYGVLTEFQDREPVKIEDVVVEGPDGALLW